MFLQKFASEQKPETKKCPENFLIIENNFCKSLSYQDWWLNGGRSFLEDFHQEAEHVEREVRVQVVQVFDHAPESLNSRNVCLILHLGKFYQHPLLLSY